MNFEIGNVAKVRHALDTAIADVESGLELTPQQRKYMARYMRAALATPPRNCDVYSHEEALQIWNELPETKETKCFDEWLYAEAKESLNK